MAHFECRMEPKGAQRIPRQGSPHETHEKFEVIEIGTEGLFGSQSTSSRRRLSWMSAVILDPRPKGRFGGLFQEGHSRGAARVRRVM